MPNNPLTNRASCATSPRLLIGIGLCAAFAALLFVQAHPVGGQLRNERLWTQQLQRSLNQLVERLVGYGSSDREQEMDIPVQSTLSDGPRTPSTVRYPELQLARFYLPLETALQSVIGPAKQWVKHKIARGDTLSSIWQRYGASRESASLAAKALADVSTQAARLHYGEEVELQVGDNGEIEGFKKWSRDGKVIVLEEDLERGYSSQLIEPEIIETEHTASGVITASFSAAARQVDVPYAVVDEYVDLFGGRVEFSRSLQPGDTFTIEYTERRTSTGTELDPGPISAASIKTGGKMLVAIRHAGDNNKPHYYDEDGNALGNFFLRYPVQFTRISSAFSESRFHPILKVHRPHNGVDFAAPIGTPVRAVADGVIEKAGWMNGGGNSVKIRHSERWATAYMHLSRISSNLRPGSRVTRGEIIGAVGMTGLATAPHLHFSLYDRGQYVNPLTTALPQMPSARPIPKDYLIASLQTLRAAHEEIEQKKAPSMFAHRSVPEGRRKV
ncbi:MAG: hypothetical protein EBZ48_07455 [Proteobacteria bacterium]|nr:hypothetical protein [Pseudomonadota bacterium]